MSNDDPVKPADTPDTPDTPERDQLVVLAAELRAEATDMTTAMRRFAEQQLEAGRQLEGQLKGINSRAVQIMRQDVEKLQAEQQKAFSYWSDRLEEATATNRILAKFLMGTIVVLLALLAWEVLR